MTIIDYYASDDQSHWLEEIKKSDWSAGQYLYELLRDHRLKELCGKKTKLLMLAENEKLISFCTYAEQDDVREPALTPWVGFVYTFPGYRGKRYMGNLLDYAETLARLEGRNYVYISTGETGLYEKYGYSFWKLMNDVNGESSRVYRKEICTPFHFRIMTIDDYEKVYALWMSCRNMGFNNLDDSREGIDKYLKRNPSTCFVAAAEDSVVGVILSGHDGRRGFIHHLAVSEEYRRQGIASGLVGHALSALKAEGINKVALLVFNYNEAGNAFWGAACQWHAFSTDRAGRRDDQGFTARNDVTYRNKVLTEMVRIDT